jgi:DNA-binding response OmpR family regulator
MHSTRLAGCLILVCEDEPLIALDIAEVFRRAGARVVIASSQQDALVAVDDAALSAAILDHALRDGDASKLCARLKERNIPFVIYSGFAKLVEVHGDAVHVSKPASTDVLVTTVVGLLKGRPAL